jgi:hypothetical protein
MIKVIDNFLPKNEFQEIQRVLTGDQIPWFQNSCIIHPEKDLGIEKYYDYQFTHVFYRNYSICSEFFPVLDPILVKVNPGAIVRIKANLIPRADKIVEHQLHTDVTGFKGLTAVFYVNTNDGYTFFETGEKINSVENRIVIFDSTLMHSGTTCTDQKNRVVINFNYYSWS